MNIIDLVEAWCWLSLARCLHNIIPRSAQPGSALWRACWPLGCVALAARMCAEPRAESVTAGRRVWSCARSQALLLKTEATTRHMPRWMHKERAQFFKVRRRSAIERATSLTNRPRGACVMPRAVVVRLRVYAA